MKMLLLLIGVVWITGCQDQMQTQEEVPQGKIGKQIKHLKTATKALDSFVHEKQKEIEKNEKENSEGVLEVGGLKKVKGP